MILLVSMVLTTCASPTSEPAPTTDPQEIENSVNATLTAVVPTEASPPTEVPKTEARPTATPLPSPTPTPTPEDTPAHGIIGDVNDDSEVNIVDTLLIAQYYVGLDPSPFNTYVGLVGEFC